MAVNSGVRKTEMKDKDGKVLLPRTTASMVSEEPDRRFMDNVEKSFLNAMTIYQDSIKNLSEQEENLLLLTENMNDIVPGSEASQAMKDVSENIEGLRVLIKNQSALAQLALIGDQGQEGISLVGTNLQAVASLIANVEIVRELERSGEEVRRGIIEIGKNFDQISSMLKNVSTLEKLGRGELEITSVQSSNRYNIIVDETEVGAPRLALSLIEVGEEVGFEGDKDYDDSIVDEDTEEDIVDPDLTD